MKLNVKRIPYSICVSTVKLDILLPKIDKCPFPASADSQSFQKINKLNNVRFT